MPMRPVAKRMSDAVPTEYSGKWVAWNYDHSQIVAFGNSLAELWQQVRDQGVPDPVYEKVPRSDVRFVGGL